MFVEEEEEGDDDQEGELDEGLACWSRGCKFLRLLLLVCMLLC